MADTMSKQERVSAALAGQSLDRVPVSAWGHDFLREWTPEGLAAATLESYRKYDWDYIKLNPRATHYGEAWGSRFRPSGRSDQAPEQLEAAVASGSDLAKIKPLDPSEVAPFADQLAALRLIAADLSGEAPFVATVFSPLAVMSRLTTGSAAVQALIKEHPGQLGPALEAVGQTLARYAAACVDAGASGIFFATVEWGSADYLSAEDYDIWCRPYDLKVLEAVRGAPLNILHVCRNHNHLERLLDYPVAVFHWSAHGEGNPSLKAIAATANVAVMGGVDQEITMPVGRPAAVVIQAQQAIAETGGRRFLMAPGCSVSPKTPETNLAALREAAGSAVPRAEPIQ